MTAGLEERKRLRRRRRRFRQIKDIFILALIISGIIMAVLLIKRAKPADTDVIQEQIERLDWVKLDLLPVNEHSRPGTKLRKVNAVVIHYIGNPGTTAEQNHSYYARQAESGEMYVSSNFIIGLEGDILECVPVNEVAYCSNSRNNDTISIECCHPDETGKFTEDTYTSAVKLTAWLCSAFDLDSSDILRHYDITGKECPKHYVDNPDEWVSFKADVQEKLDVLKSD